YVLELARSDGRLGPQLHRSTVDCAAVAAARQQPGAPASGSASSGTDRPQCGMRAGGGQMMAGGIPMDRLAAFLSPVVQRTVIDKTGLTGAFDFDLTWTPDQT